jgi:hypothetical protein
MLLAWLLIGWIFLDCLRLFIDCNFRRLFIDGTFDKRFVPCHVLWGVLWFRDCKGSMFLLNFNYILEQARHRFHRMCHVLITKSVFRYFHYLQSDHRKETTTELTCVFLLHDPCQRRRVFYGSWSLSLYWRLQVLHQAKDRQHLGSFILLVRTD